MSENGEAFVRFDGVQKSYDGETLVVKNLDLDIARGEFVTMLGPSGSGKTTCLLMLAGFIGSSNQVTLPRQMWAGIRQEISPTILSAATVLVIFSIILLTAVELLRRRGERLRGVTPG